jgi:predicted DsbA family dithiol-disulfide isomerase
MEAENLPYNDRTHTYRSRLTQELGKWVEETQSNANAFHMAAYQAYFVGNRNIGDPQVLLELVKTSGLDVDAAKNVLDKRTYEDKVDADWNKSREYGVTGVPTFVAGSKGCGGAQPYEVLASMLESIGAKKRTG